MDIFGFLYIMPYFSFTFGFIAYPLIFLIAPDCIVKYVTKLLTLNILLLILLYYYVMDDMISVIILHLFYNVTSFFIALCISKIVVYTSFLLASVFILLFYEPMFETLFKRNI